jgi:hypothetical protein
MRSATTGVYPKKDELAEYNKLATLFHSNPDKYGDKLIGFCKKASSPAYSKWIGWALLTAETITKDTFVITYNSSSGKRPKWIGYNSFWVFDSHNHYLEWISKIPRDRRVFHEYRFNKPFNFYLDIDGSDQTNVPVELRPGITKRIVSGVRETFKEEYKIWPSMESIVLCDSSDKTKYSVHLVMKDYHVANNIEARYITDKLIERLISAKVYPIKEAKLTLADLIDHHATGKSIGSLRLVGNKKFNSNRVKRIISDHKDEDTFISRATGKLLARKVEDKDYEPDILGSHGFTIYEEDVLDEIDRNIANKLGDYYNMVTRNKYGGGLIASRKRFGLCKLCDKHHHNFGLLIERRGRKFIARCGRKNTYRREEMVEDMVVGTLPYSESHIIADHLNLPHMTGYVDKNIIAPMPNAEIINMEKMPDIDFEDKDTLVIRSPIGSEKTTSLLRYLGNNPDQRVLILSFRISFTKDIEAKIKRAGIEIFSYKKIKSREIDLRNHQRVIIQINSLHRIAMMKKELNWLPHLLVLDESESLLSQFDHSALYPMLCPIKNTYETLMRNSEKVICMDACLGPRTLELIKLTRKNVKYIDNRFKKGADKTYYIVEPYHLTASIIAKLEEGDNVVCCSNMKSFISDLKQRVLDADIGVKDDDIGIYVGESTKKVKDQLDDVNKHWSKFRLLIYTSTIQAGISFNKNHYKYLFGHFTNRSCDFRACFQMLGRVRDISSKKVIVSFAQNCMERYVTWKKEALESYIENRYGDIRRRAIARRAKEEERMKKEWEDLESKFGYSFEDVDTSIGTIDARFDVNTGKYEVLNKDLYFHIKLGNVSEKLYSSNHFVACFIELIKSQGSKFQSIKPIVTSMKGNETSEDPLFMTIEAAIVEVYSKKASRITTKRKREAKKIRMEEKGMTKIEKIRRQKIRAERERKLIKDTILTTEKTEAFVVLPGREVIFIPQVVMEDEKYKFSKSRKKVRDRKAEGVTSAEDITAEVYEGRKLKHPESEEETLENIRFKLVRDYDLESDWIDEEFVKKYDNIRSRIVYSNLKTIGGGGLKESVDKYTIESEDHAFRNQHLALDPTKGKSVILSMATDVLKSCGCDTSLPLHKLDGFTISKSQLEDNLRGTLLSSLKGKEKDMTMLFGMRSDRLLCERNSTFRKMIATVKSILSKAFDINVKTPNGKSRNPIYVFEVLRKFTYKYDRWYPKIDRGICFDMEEDEDIFIDLIKT